MTPSPPDLGFLDGVLVLAVRKNFWASKECRVFPNRRYTKTIVRGPGRFGSSRNPINVLTVALEGYLYFLLRKPKLILFGSAPRIAGWFAWLNKVGLLPGVKLVAPGALYLNDVQAQYLDKLIVYSRGEIDLHAPELRSKYEFIPLPADGPFHLLQPSSSRDYIFAGGGAGRDFGALIEAVKGLDVHLEIVTFSPKTLNYSGELPENCQVHWKMPPQKFLQLMAGASFVVAPLVEGKHPHGHTTIVQALRLGKAIITTKNTSIDDYVSAGEEGLLVSSGNVSEYRQAILKLWNEPELRASLERCAHIKGLNLTYEVYAQKLVDLCHDMLTL